MTTTTNTLGEFNIGFPGQYYDAESQYWYNLSGHYVPALGGIYRQTCWGLRGD